MAISTIDLDTLPLDWIKTSRPAVCQEMGSEWFTARSAPVLQVPSSIVPSEYNYVISAVHPQFKRIKLLKRLPFSFDKRLKV
jgi:RES domain-containing protein